MDVYGGLEKEHGVFSRLRVDSQMVVPIAVLIAAENNRPFIEDTAPFDAKFGILRGMTECDKKLGVDRPCFDATPTTPTSIRPFEMVKVPESGMLPVVVLLYRYPWLREFVRIRGKPLAVLRTLSHFFVSYPGFEAWLNAQVSKTPLVQETPVRGGVRVRDLPGDVHYAIAQFLGPEGIKALIALH